MEQSSDVVKSVGFPAGGRFNKRRKTNSARSEDGGTLDTSFSRKDVEFWREKKNNPEISTTTTNKKKKLRMTVFNPAVNPRPYLPTTSHYLCTRFRAVFRSARTRTRGIVRLCFGRGRAGAERGRRRRRAVHGGVRRMNTEPRSQGTLQRDTDGLCSRSQMEMLKPRRGDCWLLKPG